MTPFKIAAIILCCVALAFSIAMFVRLLKMSKELKAKEAARQQKETAAKKDDDQAKKQ